MKMYKIVFMRHRPSLLRHPGRESVDRETRGVLDRPERTFLEDLFTIVYYSSPFVTRGLLM